LVRQTEPALSGPNFGASRVPAYGGFLLNQHVPARINLMPAGAQRKQLMLAARQQAALVAT
jgi:hypothetical protein